MYTLLECRLKNVFLSFFNYYRSISRVYLKYAVTLLSALKLFWFWRTFERDLFTKLTKTIPNIVLKTVNKIDDDHLEQRD